MGGKQQVINEAIEAMKCAERGESHPRLINYYQRGVEERIRRLDAEAALIIVADEKPQPVTKPTTTEPLDPTWRDHHGPGWSKRSD
jgi:hypothetical protein